MDTDYREYLRSLFITKVVATSREEPRLSFSITLLVKQDWTEVEYDARKSILRGDPIPPPPTPHRQASRNPLKYIKGRVSSMSSRRKRVSRSVATPERTFESDELVQRYEEQDKFCEYQGRKFWTLDCEGPLLQVVLGLIEHSRGNYTIEDMCGQSVDLTEGFETLEGKVSAGPQALSSQAAEEGTGEITPADMDVTVWLHVTAHLSDPIPGDASPLHPPPSPPPPPATE